MFSQRGNDDWQRGFHGRSYGSRRKTLSSQEKCEEVISTINVKEK
jgi:hypothetical protein